MCPAFANINRLSNEISKTIEFAEDNSGIVYRIINEVVLR